MTIAYICILISMYSIFSMHVTIEFKPNDIQHIQIPIDLIACIISKPDNKALEELFIIQTKYNLYAISPRIPYDKIRNALIPCFNLLMTCKSYYNDTVKKKSQHAIASSLKAPQGIMLFLCPNYIQLKLLKHPFKNHQDKTTPSFLLQEEAEQLVNLCFTKKEITTDEVITAVEPFMDRLNHIIYTTLGKSKPFPLTLVEYLFSMIIVKLFKRPSKNIWHSSRKNIFTLVDYLCFSEKIDVRLPIANGLNTSVERYIVQEYDKYEKVHRGTKTFNTIARLSKDTAAKSMYARPPEHPHIISGLASVFLFPSEEEIDVIKQEIKIEKKAFREKVLLKLVEVSDDFAKQQTTNFRNTLIKITNKLKIGAGIISIFIVVMITHLAFFYVRCKTPRAVNERLFFKS